MDEEMEYDIDVLIQLERLTQITTNLLSTYKKLLAIETSNSPQKETLKEIIFLNISNLKEAEGQILDFFSEDYTRAEIALDYLEENYEACSDLMSHDDLLCYTRMHEKLAQIELVQGINQEYEENKEDITQTKKYRLLKKFGYDEEDAIFLYLDYSSILDDSISLRYASLLEDEIASKPNKKDYIKMRLEEAFSSPNNLEDALFKVKFGHLRKSLSEELTPPYSFKEEARIAFIRAELDDSLLDLVNKINATKDSYELESCIILFKTYLLYIDEYDIKRIIGLIYSCIQDDNIKEQLTEYAHSYKELQASQDKDSKNKTIS